VVAVASVASVAAGFYGVFLSWSLLLVFIKNKRQESKS